MKNDDIRQALRKCEDLKKLNENEIEELISITEREVFHKGEEVFTINHEGKKFYVLLQGRLTLRLKTNQSKDYDKEGELFGEVAILGETLRFGTIQAKEDSMLVSINRERLFFSNSISKELALKITLELTRKVISYYDSKNWLSTEKSIEKGECDYIEFKKSIHEYNKTDIVKSLASFMNLNGGTIYCGVDDRGRVEGMNIDQKDFDNIQMMIEGEIKKRLGNNFIHYIHYDVEKINNKKVVRIDCIPSRSPVFFKEDQKNSKPKECFVIRSGSQNITMEKTSEVISYVQERFRNK